MPNLSQILPNNYEKKIADTVYGLRQIQYPYYMPLIYDWMHKEHVIPQWQLNEPMPKLLAYYEKMIVDDHQKLYFITINGRAVGYIEVYEAARDRVRLYYDIKAADMGFHILLGETDVVGKGYAKPIIRCLTDFIFQNSRARKVIVEPDSKNKPMSKILNALSYEPQGELDMPEKVAMLYFCYRDTFYNAQNTSPVSA